MPAGAHGVGLICRGSKPEHLESIHWRLLKASRALASCANGKLMPCLSKLVALHRVKNANGLPHTLVQRELVDVAIPRTVRCRTTVVGH